MSTPVCLANAVADALGVAEIDLPLTPAKLAALVPAHEARAVRLSARRDAGRGARGARRRGQRCRRDRGRAVAGAAALHAHGAAEAGGRHHAASPALAAFRSRTMRSASARRCARPSLLAWPELAERQPLLAQALPWVGHWQTRARGTVCGSIALADPSAELPLVLAGARRRCRSFVRERRRAASRREDFFTGLMSTARRDDELIEAVSFPCAAAGRRASRSASSRAGTATSPSWPARRSRQITTVRLAVGGVADRPVVRDFDDVERRRARRHSPRSSTRATTCTRPPTIAAISCAGSGAQPSRRRDNAAPERRRAP